MRGANMKKHISEAMVIITAVIFFSVVLAPVVFAANLSHTITVVNNSNLPLKSAGIQKANYGSLFTCGADACPGENSLTVNSSTISPGGTGTVIMTGPAGCKVNGIMSYWTLNVSGRGSGQVQCAKTWSNVCNSVLRNITCTISQRNVDAIKNDSNASIPASSVQ